MISNKEREEIAAKLRAVRDEMEKEKLPAHPFAAAVVYLQRIASCIGLNESKNYFYRLADLIEPPTCQNVALDMSHSHAPQGFQCSECNFFYPMTGFKHCPNCGAKVNGEALR